MDVENRKDTENKRGEEKTLAPLLKDCKVTGGTQGGTKIESFCSFHNGGDDGDSMVILKPFLNLRMEAIFLFSEGDSVKT